MSDINITVQDEIVNIDVIDTPVYVEVTNSPGPAGPAGVGVPVGGTTGQVLKKLSNTNYDTYWAVDAGGISSIGLTMPSAFAVANSPLTANGTLAVTATGDTTQYIAGDGSLVAFPITGQAGTLVREVRNVTGATLAKGTVVYINGASGNKPTVAKAIATSDATSAQTFGLIQADIPNNSNGYLVAFGDLDGLNTSAFAEGVQLYLSATTAGGYTSTKQYAPSHLVYIGVVTRQHVNQGRIEVRIQNGYEMDELHDVAAQTPSNNDGLFYNSTNSLWENKSIATALGYTPANSATTITINGVTFDLSANRTFTVGNVTGTGASGQVAYWTGTSAQSGSNNLFWDSANGRLGIGTNVPSHPINILSANAGLGFRLEHATPSSASFPFQITNSADTNYVRANVNIIEFFRNGGASTIRTKGSNNELLIQSVRHLQLAVNDGTTAAQLYSTGNLVLQNGGTFSDNGQRLQVIGDTLLRGSGNTSATTALTVQNSASAELMSISNDAAANRLNITGSSTAYFKANQTTANRFVQFGSNATTADFYVGSGITSYIFTNNIGFGLLKINTAPFPTAGGNVVELPLINSSFAPTSGTAELTLLVMRPLINQTGGANGITRGLYVNPTLTSAADWRSVEWSNNSGWGLYGAGTANNYLAGNLGIGITPTVRLHVSGDTILRGSGATSATTALTVQNSSSTNLFTVRNDGLVSIPSTVYPLLSLTSSNTIGGGFQLRATATGGRMYTFLATANGAGQGAGKLIVVDEDASINRLCLQSSGNFCIGTTTDISSAILIADSTTKGFLPPRMTTTQKNAISSPAAGLVVYDTTLNKLCVYTTAWETITSI